MITPFLTDLLNNIEGLVYIKPNCGYSYRESMGIPDDNECAPGIYIYEGAEVLDCSQNLSTIYPHAIWRDDNNYIIYYFKTE